jgi:hypothetical protein
LPVILAGAIRSTAGRDFTVPAREFSSNREMTMTARMKEKLLDATTKALKTACGIVILLADGAAHAQNSDPVACYTLAAT